MIEHFVTPEMVLLLRRMAIQTEGKWTHRGSTLFFNGLPVGSVNVEGGAEMVAALLSMGIPLLNELVYMHNEIEELRKQLLHLLATHPDYHRRDHGKGSLVGYHG